MREQFWTSGRVIEEEKRIFYSQLLSLLSLVRVPTLIPRPHPHDLSVAASGAVILVVCQVFVCVWC